jgi:serine/threonine protein kinase
MERRLVVIAGVDRGRVLHVVENDLMQIGRSQSIAVESRLRDPSVARVHCEVQVDGDRVMLVDGDAPEGTYVNGLRVTQQELRPSDVICIGGTQLRFLEGDLEVGTQSTYPDITLQGLPDSTAVLPAQGLVGRTLSYFTLGKMIGQGCLGGVFRARDTKNNRDVALKVLRPELFHKVEDVEHFAQIMSRALPLKHANIVRLYGVGRTGPYTWISMQDVDGKSVLELVRRMQTAGLLPWRQSLRTAICGARALAHAEEQGVYHGNLTPQDFIQRGQDMSIKISGFLVAPALRIWQAPPETPAEAVPYLPPERLQKDPVVDLRSDIYSLGATVYALLTGRPPFEAAAIPDLLLKIRQHPVIEPRKLQPYMPEPFEWAVLRMLAKSPRDRFPTAAELLDELETIARRQDVQV